MSVERLQQSARGKLILAAIVIATALFITWYLVSPRWTLHEMRAAAEAGNTDQLATYIDFPAVRASLKEEMEAKAAAEMTKGGRGAFEGLGTMLAMSFVDRMIDGVVTPAGMRQLFLSQKNPGSSANAFDASRQGLSIDRLSFDRFRLYDPAVKDGGGLIFERHGLGWQLAAVRLP